MCCTALLVFFSMNDYLNLSAWLFPKKWTATWARQPWRAWLVGPLLLLSLSWPRSSCGLSVAPDRLSYMLILLLACMDGRHDRKTDYGCHYQQWAGECSLARLGVAAGGVGCEPGMNGKHCGCPEICRSWLRPSEGLRPAAAVDLRPIGYCSLRMFMSWTNATGLTLPSSEPVSLLSDAFASFSLLSFELMLFLSRAHAGL